MAEWKTVCRGRGKRGRYVAGASGLETKRKEVEEANRRYASIKPAIQQKQRDVLCEKISQCRTLLHELIKDQHKALFLSCLPPVLKATIAPDVDDEKQKDSSAPEVDVVCYGVGPFSRSASAKWQLCFAMLMGEFLTSLSWTCDVHFYDPLVSRLELDCLTQMGVNLIDHNEEGRRTVSKSTVFFMPHCGVGLYNNVVWANWGPRLNTHVSVVGNSLKELVGTLGGNSAASGLAKWSTLIKVCPFAEETPMRLDKLQGCPISAFNDMAAHTFAVPLDVLDMSNRPPAYQASASHGDPEIVPAQ